MLDPRVILPTYARQRPYAPAGEAAQSASPVGLVIGVSLLTVVGGMFWYLTKR